MARSPQGSPPAADRRATEVHRVSQSKQRSGPGLRRKILLVAVLPTALLAVAFLVAFAAQRSRIAGQVERGMGRLAEENLARAAQDLRTLCDATHRELWQQVPRSLAVAHDQLERLGALGFSREAVTWRAVNQLDGSTAEVALPRLLLGGEWVGQNADPARSSALVDRVRELVGAEATLFQRMNARGDMIRVATTVRNREGVRAIGTYIPAEDPDGRPNPVLATVLRGETYQGRARVLDSWYLAAYEPLRDASGEVAAMLFIGLRQDSLEGIRAGVAASRIGETGDLYVIGGEGNQRGRYLIAPPGGRDGEDAWGARDARGVAHVQALVEAARSAPAGETVQVSWHRGAGSAAPRERLARVTYFAPWDWVIVAEMDRAEASAAYRKVEAALGVVAAVVLGVAALLLAATLFAARRAAARIVAPLEAMATAAERIAEGDVRQDVTYRSGDEVGRLAEAFRGTIGYIQEVARAGAALARGDLSSSLVPRSERDELTRSFQSAIEAVQGLTVDVNALARAAVEGRLEVRASPDRHRGEFRKIVEGANATVETLVRHLDAMPTPAMIVSRDFEIRYMNETGASLLGRSQRELVGTKCHDSFRMGDCGTPRCAAARAMREEREVSSESDAHPEGLDLEVVYSAVPIHDEAGLVIGAFEVVCEQTAVKGCAAGAASRSGGAPTPPPKGRASGA
jgi:HAMP domain-containing protein